jgi:hypothetical protein
LRVCFNCIVYEASKKGRSKAERGGNERKEERNKTGKKTKPKNAQKKTRKKTILVHTYLAGRRGRSCTL